MPSKKNLQIIGLIIIPAQLEPQQSQLNMIERSFSRVFIQLSFHPSALCVCVCACARVCVSP